jgi:hydroxylysine kinase
MPRKPILQAGPDPDPDPDLGAVLSSLPPDFPESAARQLAWEHFGLEGAFQRLTSERDVNWRVTGEQGVFVLKLTNPAEPEAVSDFQTSALLHLEAHDLPVPRLRRARSGVVSVPTAKGRLRVLDYLEGRMLHQVKGSAGLRRSMGGVNARLTRGLSGFAHPAARHHLQWDVRHTGGLVAFLGDLDMDMRDHLSSFVTGFDDRYTAALGACRWQVCHNDLNPHNVLTNAEGTEVTGVLDFGDMVETPLICDLGVTSSYQVDPGKPMESLLEFLCAYHRDLPLTAPEVRLVLPMVLARWATTLCITAHRARRQPENAPYILRNAPQARAGVLAFAGMDMDAAEKTISKELSLS